MLGHVSRMPPLAVAYNAIYQDIPSDWPRRPGRPRQSWLATIHRDLRQLNIHLDNVPELSVDRLLWRGLIPLWCMLLMMKAIQKFGPVTLRTSDRSPSPNSTLSPHRLFVVPYRTEKPIISPGRTDNRLLYQSGDFCFVVYPTQTPCFHSVPLVRRIGAGVCGMGACHKAFAPLSPTRRP